MTGYIYKITNITNNKIYIGQTCRSINLRWLDHCYASKYPSHKDYECPLHRAIRKYGDKNFKVEEIDTASSLEEFQDFCHIGSCNFVTLDLDVEFLIYWSQYMEAPCI